MKNIHILLISLLIISCTQPKYKSIGQEIFDGKVSNLEIVNHTPYFFIWVQTPTETKMIKLPNNYKNRWKVGDSCLLIIEKYEIIKEK